MLTGSEHPSLFMRTPLEPMVGADLGHPARPMMKLAVVADGLIIERDPPTAHDLVASGAYAYVPASTPSIVDALWVMSPAAMRALLVGAGRTVHPNETRGGLIAELVPLVESGDVSLD